MGNLIRMKIKKGLLYKFTKSTKDSYIYLKEKDTTFDEGYECILYWKHWGIFWIGRNQGCNEVYRGRYRNISTFIEEIPDLEKHYVVRSITKEELTRLSIEHGFLL